MAIKKNGTILTNKIGSTKCPRPTNSDKYPLGIMDNMYTTAGSLANSRGLIKWYTVGR